MFETEIEAGLKGIKVKAEADGGIITRVCTLTITREFDSTIASALGGAKKIHAALNAGDVTSCVLPIDRILCAIQLVADGDRLSIDKAHGTKATAKAGDPDSDTPPPNRPRVRVRLQPGGVGLPRTPCWRDGQAAAQSVAAGARARRAR
jgi:hypothetical protein